MTYFCSSFPGSPSPQAIEAATSITGVFPHLSELILKIGMQFAIHRTDQSKLFPVNVLLQYARPSCLSHWAISGCFVQIRTARSCKQPSMCFENSTLRQAISELVQPCGEALQHGFEPLLEKSCAPTRSHSSVALIGCPRGVNFL